MRKTVKCEVEQMSEIRLDKYISMSMTISRKDATNLIKASKVALNGKTVKKADEKINPDADICTRIPRKLLLYAKQAVGTCMRSVRLKV